MAQETQTGGSLLIRGASLIDGTGVPARAATVTIDRGTIRSIDGDTPSGATVLDLPGHTLLPGLIDAHTHLGLLELLDQYDGKIPVAVMAAQIFSNASRLLDAGFTTARDVGGVDGGLAQAIEKGLVRGPHLFPSGPVLCQTGGHGDYGPSFHPHGHGVPGLSTASIVCDGPDEVRRAARTALRRGATQVKVCVSGGVMSYSDSLDDSQFSIAELRSAVEEAHARRTYVTAHAHTVPGIRNGLAAGIECFEHGTFLDEDTVSVMASSGVALVPTLAVLRVAVERWREMGIPEDLVPRFEGVEDAMAASVKLAHAAGILIGSGSDLFGPVQDRFGLELVLKARILGPMEAIVSATATNARILRVSDRLGTIAPGRAADLIAIAGDPLTDPELFDDPSRVAIVIKAGRVVKDNRE
jgi:imidazolonepropionase-like amidohydrolase